MSHSLQPLLSDSNKNQLIEVIRRSRTGLVMSDIKDCYEGVEADVSSLIVGGDIIAIKNKVSSNIIV